MPGVGTVCPTVTLTRQSELTEISVFDTLRKRCRAEKWVLPYRVCGSIKYRAFESFPERRALYRFR